jgi:hypothetical protein
METKRIKEIILSKMITVQRRSQCNKEVVLIKHQIQGVLIVLRKKKVEMGIKTLLNLKRYWRSETTKLEKFKRRLHHL